MSEKLNITYRPIKELKPYKKNAKKHNKEQILAQQLFFLHEPKVYIVHCDVHANAVPVQKEHGI